MGSGAAEAYDRAMRGAERIRTMRTIERARALCKFDGDA
jgi:hypothetical protein